ncbi:MAG TPA: nucleoside diphosphate kinase regulator [Kofleriaceae bacterium]|nr:nucleoside diphosphate kinase regulator [Kofleriaceae bacterium]
MTSPPIIVASEDREHLLRLMDQQVPTEVADQLEAELERARVVPWHEVPADVIVMNSELEYEDTATGQRRRMTLVYPANADMRLGRVSVLAPLGCALIGLQVGQEIDWRMPGGLRRLRVVAVTHSSELDKQTAG